MKYLNFILTIIAILLIIFVATNIPQQNIGKYHYSISNDSLSVLDTTNGKFYIVDVGGEKLGVMEVDPVNSGFRYLPSK